MENKGDPVRAYVYPCNESGSIVEFGDKEWIMCVECDEEQDEEYGPSPIDPKRAIRNSELTNERKSRSSTWCSTGRRKAAT